MPYHSSVPNTLAPGATDRLPRPLNRPCALPKFIRPRNALCLKYRKRIEMGPAKL